MDLLFFVVSFPFEFKETIFARNKGKFKFLGFEALLTATRKFAVATQSFLGLDNFHVVQARSKSESAHAVGVAFKHPPLEKLAGPGFSQVVLQLQRMAFAGAFKGPGSGLEQFQFLAGLIIKDLQAVYHCSLCCQES